MTTALIMFAIILALGVIVIAGCKKANKETFFDINNSSVMRGAFSIIILFVHVPQGYTNRIQDMVGSFAYVGVTFFFMTSAYGLTLSVLRRPDCIKHFWKRRLVKLFVPMFLINVLFFILTFLDSGQLSLGRLLSVNNWVAQLILFYFVFWLVFRFTKLCTIAKVAVVSGFIVVFSLVAYFFAQYLPFSWAVEAFGFIYGMLLALHKEQIYSFISKKFIWKLSALAVLSCAFGVAYLKYKDIFFFGGYVLRLFLGLFIILLVLAINTKTAFANKVSLFLGSISYEIYLIHAFVFDMISKHIPTLESGVFILSGIVITVALSTAVSYMGKFILSLFNKKDTKPKSITG